MYKYIQAEQLHNCDIGMSEVLTAMFVLLAANLRKINIK